jgi:hypothetical protein
LKGEISIIKPKPVKKPGSRMVKKLSDHSLTRMTKRSFKPKLRDSDGEDKSKAQTPRERKSSGSPVRKRPMTA